MSTHTHYTSDERYLTYEEIREQAEDELLRDASADDIAEYMHENGIRPLHECSCGRALDQTSPYPICRTCEGTYRAHARLERHHAEWVRDGRPE